MIDSAVQRALRPNCFFLATPWKLRVEHFADETVRWEIFRGQLLEPAQTRRIECFAAWHVFLDPGVAATVPLLSIRWHREQRRVFVTRQILCRGFEAYEDDPGVILSRPVEKWVSELVGTLEAAADDDTLARELERFVFLAVAGTSRLPITSLETPLPAFSLGQLAYLPMPRDASDAAEPWNEPIAFLAKTLATKRSIEEHAKALETALRAEPTQPSARLTELLTETFSCLEHGSDSLASLMRAVFNGVALSPYTHFADALVSLILKLADASWFGPAVALDVVGYMLRNLCRHLTAFDLTLFHNFGANYPDALFLDALLVAYLRIAETNANLVSAAGPSGRLRRRAVRQACLVRRHYEGHAVPDAPTSMGENARVLPEPFAGVPEEQIVEMGKRRRKLFVDQTTDARLGDFGRRVLSDSLAELDEPRELRELGMALFLDRPLGVLKEPGEVDRTPLLSYEAFSRSIVRRRIKEFQTAGWIDERRRDAWLAATDALAIRGVPVADLAPSARPGVVSIADAGKAAADFVLLRTTRGSLDALLSHYDLRPLADVAPETAEWLSTDRNVLFVQCVPPEKRPLLRAYCGNEVRLELKLREGTSSAGAYRDRDGVELLPLQVLTINNSSGTHDVVDQSIWLKPKSVPS